MKWTLRNVGMSDFIEVKIESLLFEYQTSILKVQISNLQSASSSDSTAGTTGNNTMSEFLAPKRANMRRIPSYGYIDNLRESSGIRGGREEKLAAQTRAHGEHDFGLFSMTRRRVSPRKPRVHIPASGDGVHQGVTYCNTVHYLETNPLSLCIRLLLCTHRPVLPSCSCLRINGHAAYWTLEFLEDDPVIGVFVGVPKQRK